MRFTATLEESGRGGGHWVACPFDGRAAFGSSRATVAGTVNGTPFRTRLMVYGGETYLGFAKPVRDLAAIEAGDKLKIELERDDAPREVEFPEAFAAALAADPGARAIYDALPYTQRKEYATWVAEAKREDTRRRRTTKAIEMLLAGTRHP